MKSQIKIKKRKTQKQSKLKKQTQRKKTSKNKVMKKRGGVESESKGISKLNEQSLHNITRFLTDNQRNTLYHQNKNINNALGKDCEGLDVNFISMNAPQYIDDFWKETINPNTGSHVQCWKSNHPPIPQNTLRPAIQDYLNEDKRDDIIKKWGMIENWNVSNVTNMRWMFRGAKDFNQNIGGWNVSNVKSMCDMFYYTRNFNQNIGGWNVSNVTDMTGMFENAESFNQNIGGWNVSNVNMWRMFYKAGNFNQDIGGWNVSNVTNMERMFNYAESFNQDIGGWNVSHVTDMREMFTNSPMVNNPPEWYSSPSL